MSRTYRNVHRCTHESKETFVHHVERKFSHYKFVFTEEGKIAYEKAIADYRADNWDKPELHVTEYHYMKLIAVTKEIDYVKERKENEALYNTFTRDGVYNETGRNKAFKTLNKKAVRTANRILENKIKADHEYDQKSYPGDYLGKCFIWSVW